MTRPLTLTILAVSCLVAFCASGALADEGSDQKAVLVTGSSSGIGLKITEKLAASGFYVYAGARKPTDLERLDAMDNVSSVQLDVTVQEEIDAAVQFVRDQGRGLFAIVNNAGVTAISQLTSGPESDMDFVFDVNVYGPYRINKAFLPLVKESGGHTTTIGSIAGFTGRSGIYSMSKFAVEAYTDSLARELEDTDVHVSVIEPGSFKSNIRLTRAARALAAAESGDLELTAQERARHENADASRAGQKEPDEVADAILALMTADNPKRRYLVTPNERQAHSTIRTALRRIVQLNHDQLYALDRDGLVALLDELLEEIEED